MPNHLINEASPYLLQHANNPVDWYPWGEIPLQKAKDEVKPIFLSIGYSACHWCHVMEKESFENDETAKILNDKFICIKVDREQRPDLDNIYMDAVFAITGQGGWPLSVFLTPELMPFYGGTYFPPIPRFGLPAFNDILFDISRKWENDPRGINQTSQKIFRHLTTNIHDEYVSGDPVDPSLVSRSAKSLINFYDDEYGGWGNAPKFPLPINLLFLIDLAFKGDKNCKTVINHALSMMCRGGIYDILGGGFHRYSTDEHWLIPHFEKMLYDNAQLALAYLRGYLLTGEMEFKTTCEGILDFLARELLDPAGGLYSSIDADSEGIEGKFYIWTYGELRSILSQDEFNFLSNVFHLPIEGNFNGKVILQHQKSRRELIIELGMDSELFDSLFDSIQLKLFDIRTKRIHPSIDDKILTSWNALALISFAEAARYLNRPDYLSIAKGIAEFLLCEMVRDGNLLRSWRNGNASIDAYLEDYSALILGLYALYQADFNPALLNKVDLLIQDMIKLFYDPDLACFFDTSNHHQGLIYRPKTYRDNVIPSGSAMAVYALLLHAAFTGNDYYRHLAEKNLSSVQHLIQDDASGFPFWLQAMDFAHSDIKQVALVWPQNENGDPGFFNLINSTYRPNMIFGASPFPPCFDSPEFLQGRLPVDNQTTAYVCHGFNCKRPVTTIEEFSKLIDDI
jgi:uncharacterized protein